MPTPRFSRYVLRTSDVPAASAFYRIVLERSGDGAEPLPEAAVACGARPHWLGHIGLASPSEVSSKAADFTERGATRLGPPSDGNAPVILRDPGGALLALGTRSEPSLAGVGWHQLNTARPDRAAENYSALFGWSFTDEIDLGPHGNHQRLAFAAGEASAGIVSGLEERPQVHPHWLFFFTVPSLDAAVQRVHLQSGKVIGPLTLPNGVRVAACDDPQGAAFGLIEPGDAQRLANE